MKRTSTDFAPTRETTCAPASEKTEDRLFSSCAAGGSLIQNGNVCREILEIIPVPVIIHKDGRFIYANTEAVQLHGFNDFSEMSNSLLSDFVHRDDREIFSDLVFNQDGGQAGRRQAELRIVRADKQILDVEVASVPVVFGGLQARLAVCMDRTEKKRARTALVNNLMFMETLIDTIPNPIFYKDVDGLYRGCNKMFAAKILGVPRREIVGKTVFDFSDRIPPEYAKVYWEHDRKLLRNAGVQVYETRVKCADGADREFIFYKAAYIDSSGKIAGLVGIMVDITDLRKAERNLYRYQEQLRGLSNSVTLAEELERRKIAENLHERIGQTLAVSKMKLGVLREAIPTAELVRELDEIRELIGETIQDARSLTFELSPPVLHEVGLMAGLEWLVEKFDAQSDIEFQFKNDGKNLVLDDNIRVLLFRAARELLFNVTSHSRAERCVVEIFDDGENVHVGVEDDGVGFDIEKVDGTITEPSGFGLFSIRERMNHLGGKFMVDSKPGKGARVAIVSPKKYGRKQFSEKAGT